MDKIYTRYAGISDNNTIETFLGGDYSCHRYVSKITVCVLRQWKRVLANIVLLKILSRGPTDFQV